MNNIIYCFLLLISFSSFGQKDTIYVWNKWCSNKDTNVLFITSYNMIQVYSPTFQPDQLEVKSLDRTLKIGTPENNKDTINILAMPYTTDKPMRFVVINTANNKVLRTVNFFGEDVPQPVAYLGNLREPVVPKAAVLAQVRLKVLFPNSFYSYPYHIIKYTFKTRYNKTDITIPVKGSIITKDVEKAMNLAPVGTMFEFTEIKATCPECVIKDLSPLRITIK